MPGYMVYVKNQFQKLFAKDATKKFIHKVLPYILYAKFMMNVPVKLCDNEKH